MYKNVNDELIICEGALFAAAESVLERNSTSGITPNYPKVCWHLFQYA